MHHAVGTSTCWKWWECNCRRLGEEARKLKIDKLPCVVTFCDINAVVESRLKYKAVKLKH